MTRRDAFLTGVLATLVVLIEARTLHGVLADPLRDLRTADELDRLAADLPGEPVSR